MTDNKVKTKSMSYVDKPVLTEKQMIALVQSTPKEFIRTRKGRGGRQFSYTTVSYVQDRLNQIFGWGWSFEVKEHGDSPQGSVWVLGRLTVLDPTTKQILVSKEQFGSSEYKKDQAGKEIDYADDMKAAASDALKKCSSLLGIALDLYSVEEVAEGINARMHAVVADIKARKLAEKEESQNVTTNNQ